MHVKATYHPPKGSGLYAGPIRNVSAEIMDDQTVAIDKRVLCVEPGGRFEYAGGVATVVKEGTVFADRLRFPAEIELDAKAKAEKAEADKLAAAAKAEAEKAEAEKAAKAKGSNRNR